MSTTASLSVASRRYSFCDRGVMNMDNMLHLAFAWLGTATVLSIAVISAKAYDHREGAYASGKAPARSLTHFAYVYRYLQVSSIAIAIACFWSDWSALAKLPLPIGVRFAGLVGAGFAVAVFIWSKRTLGKHYSPCFDAYLPKAIVSAGPYQYVRHPIYTANIGLLLALGAATGSVWLFLNATILFVYYRHAAIQEEQELSTEHREYEAYIRGTGRFLPARLIGTTSNAESSR